jgi:hypothetical protein
MTPHGEVALTFTAALVHHDFTHAHEMLAPELRARLSAAQLRDKFFGLFEGYAEGQPTSIHCDEQFSMTEWPDKEPNDVGWAYVSIMGEDFVEAVAVTVANVGGALLIRAIEWGRP